MTREQAISVLAHALLAEAEQMNQEGADIGHSAVQRGEWMMEQLDAHELRDEVVRAMHDILYPDWPVGIFMRCPRCGGEGRMCVRLNKANPSHPDPTETYTLECGHTVI